MKKLVTLLLAMALLVPTAALAEKTISNEPVTLKISTLEVEVAGCSYADPLPVFQQIEENTGVHIEWDIIPTDYSTVMATRISSMDNLPDLMMNPGLSSAMLMTGGIAADLTDLVNEHGPNITKHLELNPAIAAEMYAPDGKLYLLPMRVQPFECYGTNLMTFIIRYDWLKQCGIENPPSSIEDWYNVLTAFRNQDPNGNAQADETPFCTNVYLMKAFAVAWGLDLLTDFAVDANGHVFYQWTTPQAKDWLTEMSKWYAEGLIAPDYLTDRNIDTRHLENQTGASYMWSASNCDWQNKNNTTSVTEVDWRPIPPPKNVYSGEDSFVPIAAKNLYGNTAIITNANGKADLAVKWVDYLWSDEGILLTNMGIEGVSYAYEDGVPRFIPEFLDGGNWYQNMKAYGIDPGYLPRVHSIHFALGQTAGYSDTINEAAAKVVPYIRASFPEYLSTEDEDLIMTTKYNDIKTYADEMLHKFIIGTEPLDGFDAFVAKIESIGLNDVLAIKQAQYDRNK